MGPSISELMGFVASFLVSRGAVPSDLEKIAWCAPRVVCERDPVILCCINSLNTKGEMSGSPPGLAFLESTLASA
jgi:hypothetical protein